MAVHLAYVLAEAWCRGVAVADDADEAFGMVKRICRSRSLRLV